MSQSSQPRRSPMVVLLDAMLNLATAVQSGNLPGTGGGTRPGRAAIAWLVVGVLAAAGGTALLVGAVLRTPDGLADLPPGGGVAAPAPTTVGAAVPVTARPSSPAATTTAPVSSAPTTSPSTGKSTSTTTPSSQPAAAGDARLSAAYTAADGLLGYRASVTITGQGPGTADGWQLTITMPRPTLQLAAVSGATVEQNGTVWTFTPTGETRQIPQGTSVAVVFDVRGATLVDAKPTACRINDESCTGAV